MNPYHANRQLNKYKRKFIAKLSSFRIPLSSSFRAPTRNPYRLLIIRQLADAMTWIKNILVSPPHRRTFAKSLLTFAKTRPKLAIATLFILVLTPTLIFALRNANRTQAGWFHDSWNYRQSLPINNTGSALADYQIKLTLNTSTLITNKKLQATCADLRFTNFDGVELPYWIEASTCNTSSTYIWIKVDSIPAGGTTILMYYGNPTAVPGSNIDNTFIFGDDFNGPDTTKFDYATLGSSWYSFPNGTLRLISDATYRALKSFKTFNPTESYIIGTRMSFDTGSANWHHSYLIQNSDASRNRFGLQENAGTGAYRVQYRRDAEATWQYSANITTLSANTWYKSEIINQGTTTSTTLAAKLYSDAWSQLGSTVSVSATEWADETWAWNTWVNTATYHYLDWLIVRQYVATEPTFGTAGSEEGGGGPILHFTFDEAAGTTAYNNMETTHNPSTLIAHWKLDETSGTTINDATGTLNGTATGTSVVDGKIGKARSFAGGTDAINFGDANVLKQTGSQTISMWLYPTSIASNRQNPWCKSYGGEGCITQEMSGVLNYYYGTAGANSTPYTAIGSLVAVTQNAWNHVVIVRDLSKMTLTWYINGQQTNQIAAAYSAAVASTLSAYIGQGYTTNYIGRIDNVKITDRPWSAAEVASEYTSIQGHFIGDVGHNLGATPPDQKPLGTSAMFSGTTNEYIDLGDRPEFERTTFSISAWVYRLGNCGAYNSCTILAKGESGNIGYGFRIDYSSNAYYPRLDIRDSQQTLTGTTPINTNTWYHLTAVADGSTYKLYVNGKLDNSAAVSVTPTFSSESVTIGNRNSNKDLPMNGYIDELKFFAYALTDEQVEIEYNRGAGTALAVGVHPNDPSDYLIGWWKMDENTATITDSYGNMDTPTLARDSSVYKNHGNPTNSAYFTPGKFGNAAYFDGTNDFIQVPHNSVLMPSSITISGWVKLTANQAWMMVNKGTAGTSGSYYIYGDSLSNAAFVAYSSALTRYQCDMGALPLDGWAYLVGTLDAGTGTMKCYVDGQLKNTVTGASLGSNTTDLLIGKYNAGGYQTKGYIDDVRIFNTALTTAQISYLYSQGGPILHYSFDEGAGTTANNQDQIAPITNLLGWWKFNDATSGTTPAPVDEMNTYSATFGGSAAYTSTAKIGNAVTLNGTNSYINVPYNFGQPNTLTVSMWFRTSATSISALFGQANTQPTTAPTSWVPTILMNASGTLRAEIWTGAGGSIVSTTAYNDGNWHHLALTGDVTTQSLYVDGILIGSRTGTISLTWWLYSTFGTGYIDTARGSAANAWYYFNGQIDDARIYNRSLSPGEVSILANSKHADALNGPTWSTGATPPGQKPLGTAVSFNGTNQYISFNPIQNGNLPRTFSAWIKDVPTSGRYEIANFQHSFVNIQDGKLCFYVTGSNSTYLCSDNAIPTNQWVHVVASYDNGVENVYVNGKLDGTTTLSATSDTSNYASTIGVCMYCAYTSYFSGSIDEVKIFNYALTQEEIDKEYNRGQAVALGVGENPHTSTATLLGWWKFDDPSGSLIAQDSSGKNNTGKATSTSTVPGIFGSARSFNGTTNYVVDTGTNIDLVNKSFTLSAWAKQNVTGVENFILGQGGYVANQGLYFGFRYTDQFTCAFYSNNQLYSQIADTNWHHWACTYDYTNQTRTIYKDGIPVVTGTSIAAFTGTGNFYLGAGYSLTNPFNGTIDNIKVWEGALTPAQIAYEYNQGKPIYHWSFDQDNGVIATNTEGTATPTDGLVGFWTMDSTTVNDMSGNGNNLTNSGSPTYVTNAVKGGAVDYLASSSQYSTCTDANCGAYLDYQGNGFTVSAWIYGDSANTSKNIIGKQDWVSSTDNGGYVLYTDSDNTIKFILRNSNGVSTQVDLDSDVAVSTTAWQHVVGVYNGQTAHIYINGQLKKSGNYTGGIKNTSSNFSIGTVGTNTTSTFDGKIDHVKVWQRALSDKEVAREYESLEKYGLLTNFPTDNSQWVAGKSGNALNFDGTNDHLVVPNHFDQNLTHYTVSGWINIASLSDSTQHYMLSRYSWGGNQGYGLSINSSGKILCDHNGSSGRLTTTNNYITAGTWYHVACTYDGTTLSAVLNGEVVESVTRSALSNYNSHLYLGTPADSPGNNSYTFSGKIDEVKLFPYALTETQLRQEYQTGSAAVKL